MRYRDKIDVSRYIVISSRNGASSELGKASGRGGFIQRSDMIFA